MQTFPQAARCGERHYLSLFILLMRQCCWLPHLAWISLSSLLPESYDGQKKTYDSQKSSLIQFAVLSHGADPPAPLDTIPADRALHG